MDFVFDGNEIRGLEQNPTTKSRWAQMARSRRKAMQFLSDGPYVANGGRESDSVRQMSERAVLSLVVSEPFEVLFAGF